MKYLTSTLLALSIALFTLPTQAANSGSGAGTSTKRTYAAVAVAEKSRAHGYSFSQSTRNKAREVALRECRKHARDCKVEMTSNTCLAFAKSKTGGWGVSRRKTQFKARTAALKQCRKNTRGCRTQFAVCNRGN